MRRKCQFFLAFFMTAVLAEGVTVQQSQASQHHEERHEHETMHQEHQEEEHLILEEESVFFQSCHTGPQQYCSLILTGEPLGEQQVYSLQNIEELAMQTFQNATLAQTGILQDGSCEEGIFQGHTIQGIDLLAFLDLCGADLEEDSLYAACYCGSSHQEASVTLDLKASLAGNNQRPVLVFGQDHNPVDENGAAFALLYEGEEGLEALFGLEKIILGYGQVPEDPHYNMHLRSPHDESREIPFTVRIFRGEASEPEAEKSFTTAELEDLAIENPEHISGGYYGLIGNEESRETMGLGGYMDYYEGLDLKWFLESQMEVENFSGYGELYGRDGQIYATIEDLSYFEGEDPSDYYLITDDGTRISGSVPILSFAKNGYPLLPEHDHETAAYVDYNQLNKSLAAMGITTEIGVVKNHSGPFVAGLGNYDGYYGGYQEETGGDCVQIDLHLAE